MFDGKDMIFGKQFLKLSAKGLTDEEISDAMTAGG
jgi:hypothetical protein